ncbi:IclR family transcriptional regulator [Nocardioides sp. L-11A]|jgi:DNA-binding IclR family transcriptional regulator|uniref:IclR family transcriptional regulator n=1 Tax=unclassified Nocardioides TaxID=2615069 RepID=UPI002499C224|nr:IclR family transcriptional regulator [Nocardioides sp. L-11A]
MSASSTLSTLERGIAMLEYVAEHGPITAKRVAREMDLKTSSCYHVLRTLVGCGFLARLEDGTYDVGPRSHAYAKAVQAKYAIQPELALVLTRLHNLTRETAYISGWRDGNIVLLHYIAGLHALNVGRLAVGYTGDMHARASCKAVLAHLPEEHVAAMFSGVRLVALTANTITDFEELRVELVQTRRQGFAIDREEYVDGVSCVSAPYFDRDGNPLGAFTVSVPTERFQRSKARLIESATQAASIATRLMTTGRLSLPDLSEPPDRGGPPPDGSHQPMESK